MTRCPSVYLGILVTPIGGRSYQHPSTGKYRALWWAFHTTGHRKPLPVHQVQHIPGHNFAATRCKRLVDSSLQTPLAEHFVILAHSIDIEAIIDLICGSIESLSRTLHASEANMSLASLGGRATQHLPCIPHPAPNAHAHNSTD